MKKNDSIFRNMKYFVSITNKNFPLFLPLSILKIILTSAIPFINIFVSKMIIDELIGNQDIEYLVILILVLVIGNVVLGFLEYIVQMGINLITDKISKKIEMDLNSKAMTINYEYLEDPEICEMVERANLGMTNYTRGLSENMDIINRVISNIIIFAGIISIIIVMNAPWLIVVSGVSILFNLIMEKFYNQIDIKYNEPLTRTSRRYEYFNYALKHFPYAKDVRLYHSQPMIRQYSEDINKIRNTARKKKYSYIFTLSVPSVIFRMLFENLISFIILIYMVASNEITIAQFTMLWISISTFTSSITIILSSYQKYKKISIYQNKYIDFMELPLIERSGDIKFEKAIKTIEFKNVSFKYPRTEKYILKNLNFKINNGERLSIVGLNGCGKTTIVKLLCRFHEVEEGEILINGINIKDYEYNSYIDIFSIVFQDFKIISFPVKENVSIIDDNQEKLYDCLNRAGLLEKILSLPYKENTFVSKWFDDAGVEFSGGEMQKIAIARALYKDGSFVILDEPTAALDPITEAEIYLKFNSIIGENKTTIFISHRLSSCKFCDRIIVLDDQRIVEEGTHDELMMRPSGLYQKMFNAQAEYYKS